MGKALGYFLKTLIYLLSLCGIGYFAYQLYLKWAVTPDITINVRDPPERELPFPAITSKNLQFQLETF